VIAAWETVKFYRARAQQIYALVNALITALGLIADGKVEEAALLIEDALAASIPLALEFLAQQVGLTDIRDQIGEQIAEIQAIISGNAEELSQRAIEKGYNRLNNKPKDPNQASNQGGQGNQGSQGGTTQPSPPKTYSDMLRRDEEGDSWMDNLEYIGQEVGLIEERPEQEPTAGADLAQMLDQDRARRAQSSPSQPEAPTAGRRRSDSSPPPALDPALLSSLQGTRKRTEESS